MRSTLLQGHTTHGTGHNSQRHTLAYTQASTHTDTRSSANIVR